MPKWRASAHKTSIISAEFLWKMIGFGGLWKIVNFLNQLPIQMEA